MISSAEQFTLKTQAMLTTLIEKKDISFYLKRVHKIENHKDLVLLPSHFTDLLSTKLPFQKTIRDQPDSDLVKRLTQFIQSNKLNSEMVSATYLSLSQNAFLNIIFLVEIQKNISERTDLPYFGAESIKNLNIALSDRIQALYNLTESYLTTARFNQPIAEKMKRNFVSIGLDYENFLAPEEQLLNEYYGLDKAQIREKSPIAVLKTLNEIAVRKTQLQLKLSPFTCSALFS
jgi:hypothetical protein